MNYKVRKGIKRELMISGMPVKFFYAFLIIGCVNVVFLAMVLLWALNSGRFFEFILFLLASIVFLLGLKVGLSIKGQKSKKMPFNKKEYLISNVDLFENEKLPKF